MKRLMISLLGAFAFAAAAQAADRPAQETTAQDATTQTTQDQAKKRDINDRNCLRYTGSHIQRRADKKDRPCLSATGRSYTSEDIDQTGEVELADALRKLDVSIH
ncbi:MAG TPA: hypothetical protein VGQ93_17205 [Lysobacter sp.]|jgi:hypothetical protein|nr:hypothetical protein [Lysobacter sp.]